MVRENNEGEYSEIGGRLHRGTDHEVAIQESVFTKFGTDRILRYAFGKQLGLEKVTSATKSNGIIYTMPYWDERFSVIAEEYPMLTTDQYHIDILTANFVLHPDWFDVVGSNLFGDICRDLTSCSGSIAIAPSAILIQTETYHLCLSLCMDQRLT